MTEEEQSKCPSRLHGTGVAKLLSLCPKLEPDASLLLLRRPCTPFGYSLGVCTHPDAADDSYLHSREGGEKLITDASVPSGFRWIGALDRGLMECLFAMWREGDRWFWFYDVHVFYFDPLCEWTSHDHLRLRFARALDRWNSGQKVVIYCIFWGWYNPDTGKFEPGYFVPEPDE